MLVNDEEKQDGTILVEDKSFAESDKVTLCDDVSYDSICYFFFSFLAMLTIFVG